MTLRFWLTTVCSTIVSVTTLYFGLNYSKFCFKQMRYLSDKEKIQMAFNYQNNRERIPIETVDKGTQYYRQIRYDNFEEFIQKNPNCCQVNPGGGYDLPPANFLDRITGYNSGDAIVLNFEVRYLDDKGNQKSKIIKFENAPQNCGAVRW